MPRERLVGALEAARTALGDARGPVAARVTAALARQLQHSVPADRPRAGPLAEEAVALARDLDDVGTLASCLLAQHDSLWTPGTAVRRVEIAREITALTRTTGDREALAQGLLLTANAQLESGSPEFRATLRGLPRRDPVACGSPGTTTCCERGRRRSPCWTGTSTSGTG